LSLLAALALSFSMLGHLLAEVHRVEGETVKQEP
jgi:hypothetical protein